MEIPPKPAAAAPPSSRDAVMPSGSKTASDRYRPNSIPDCDSIVSASTPKPKLEYTRRLPGSARVCAECME